MSIYIVDDEPLIAETTAAILMLHGYPSIAFSNPYQALEAVNRGCPGLLVVDMKMPGMSGYDFATQAKEICQEVQILFFTGDPGVAELLRDLEERRFFLLCKPVRPDELLAAVEKILGF